MSSRYFVVARTTAPQYGKEYISLIEASQNEAREKGEPLMTWEQFLKVRSFFFFERLTQS